MELSRLNWFRCAPLAVLLCASGCSSSSDDKSPAPANVKPSTDDWTMLAYDNKSTYWNQAETKISVKTAPNLDKAWEFDGGGNVTSTPLISGGKVYVLSAGLTALDLATGAQIWQNPSPAGFASPALDNGVIYIHDAGGTVWAFSEKDGSQIWSYKTTTVGGAVGFSSPVITKDYVLVGGSTLEEIKVPTGGSTFRGFVVAVNKKDGSLAWQKYTVEDPARGATLWSTVSVDEDLGMVYLATGNNHGPPATDTSDAFLALPLKDGSDFKWKQQIFTGDIWEVSAMGLSSPDNDFGANPIVFDFNNQKLVAGGNKGGDFWVLDREQGTVIKKRHLGPNSASRGGVFVNGAWDGKHLLVVCNGATSSDPGSEPANGSKVSVLFALDPSTLDIVWSRQLGAYVYSPITVANGVGFFGKDLTLQAFNTETGAVLKEFATEATIDTAPAISNGYVVFGSGMTWDVATPGTKFYALKVP